MINLLACNPSAMLVPQKSEKILKMEGFRTAHKKTQQKPPFSD